MRSRVLHRPLQIFGNLSPPTNLPTLPTLATRRRQLQHAADGEYPFTDLAYAGMRCELET